MNTTTEIEQLGAIKMAAMLALRDAAIGYALAVTRACEPAGKSALMLKAGKKLEAEAMAFSAVKLGELARRGT